MSRPVQIYKNHSLQTVFFFLRKIVFSNPLAVMSLSSIDVLATHNKVLWNIQTSQSNINGKSFFLSSPEHWSLILVIQFTNRPASFSLLSLSVLFYLYVWLNSIRGNTRAADTAPRNTVSWKFLPPYLLHREQTKMITEDDMHCF